jgi:Domain of Unknown Function with PDB structure (DUF3857)
MRYFLLLFLSATLFRPNPLRSQPPPMEFGKVSVPELKMKVYEADSTAAAVVLCDYATAVVEPHTTSYHLVWKHHKRIKLLNKQGFDYANVAIPFYSHEKREEFLFDDAAVYFPDGKKINLTRKDVVVEKINAYFSLAKFTFPQVTEGCVIEYAYTIQAKSIYELREWFFQSEIPVVKSEIRADFPEFVDYVYLFQGNEDMLSEKDKDGNTRFSGKNGSFLIAPRRFVMENAPAMKEEAYITTMDDYRARVRFQLSDIAHAGGYVEKVMSDWPNLQKDIMASSQFGDQMLKKANYKKMAEKLLPLAAGLTSNKEKAWFFYDYLTKNIRWSESYSMYTHEKKLSEIFEQGEANSGELNMMLYVLLTESGMKASPVLLSTRGHGKMYEEYPIRDQFNHLVVAMDIEGKQVFLDASDPLRPPGYPSIPSLNGRGLKLDFATGRPTWINITPPRDGTDALTFNLRLDEEGTLTGSLTTAHKGYNAMPERRGIGTDNGSSLWQKRLVERFPEVAVMNARIGNLHEIEKPFYDTLEISIPNAAQVSGDHIYLSPIIYSEFDENLFKLKERLYPVDIPYPFVEQVTLNLTLPDGYEIESLPKLANASVPSGGGSYFFASTAKADGTVQFSASLNMSKQKFTPADYPALKTLFDVMVKKRDELIVIKKKA